MWKKVFNLKNIGHCHTQKIFVFTINIYHLYVTYRSIYHLNIISLHHLYHIYIIYTSSLFLWIRSFKLNSCSTGFDWLWFLPKKIDYIDFVFYKNFLIRKTQASEVFALKSRVYILMISSLPFVLFYNLILKRLRPIFPPLENFSTS